MAELMEMIGGANTSQLSFGTTPIHSTKKMANVGNSTPGTRMKLFPPARLPFLKRMIPSGGMSEQQTRPGVSYAMICLEVRCVSKKRSLKHSVLLPPQYLSFPEALC